MASTKLVFMESGSEDFENLLHVAFESLREHPLLGIFLLGMVVLLAALSACLNPDPIHLPRWLRTNTRFPWQAILTFGVLCAIMGRLVGVAVLLPLILLGFNNETILGLVELAFKAPVLIVASKLVESCCSTMSLLNGIALTIIYLPSAALLDVFLLHLLGRPVEDKGWTSVGIISLIVVPACLIFGWRLEAPESESRTNH